MDVRPGLEPGTIDEPDAFAVATFGDYGWMWYADALLATMAALTNLPIREARVVRAPATAAAE